ncbi:MAG TPA: cytochrome P450 [Actinospica sp.]|jgi:cytochrome P450|nr:cytochrome P450 [Actinospica sp.]
MSVPEPVAFPFPPEQRGTSREVYAERRTQCPMGRVRLPSGHDAVLLVRHDDVAAGLADTRLSHDLTAPGSPRTMLGSSFLDTPDGLLNKDGPEHLRIRRIVASTFTPRRIERWVPAIRAIAAELVDDLEKRGSPADLVPGFCFTLPVRVICRLLGVPERDLRRFQSWSNAFLLAAKMTDAERLGLVLEFAEYAKDLITARRAEPGKDLLDELIAARDGRDALSEDELMIMVIGLIAAGNETTSNALGRSIVTLLNNDRALWEQLIGRPDLLPAAVDELLRHSMAGNGLLRQAVEDVELPSGTVRRGDAVVLSLEAAAFDEQVYPDPESVLFDREPPAQIAFGAGPHYCLGAHLAKAELRIGLGTLLERLPGLRLEADPASLRYTGGEVMSSIVEIPVSW